MKKVEIIAEIAQGYEGNETLALLLTKAAINSNADAVKFQLVIADELAVPDYEYYNFFKSLFMSYASWEKIVDTVRLKKKKIYFDIFGDQSLEIASNLKVDGVKLSTTEFYNDELLETAINLFPKIFLSIGGIPIDDIRDKLKSIPQNHDLTIMYGIQSEPTLIEDNNLLRIEQIKRLFPNVKIGFMDHTLGKSPMSSIVSVLSLGLGINVIEKHITLDRILNLEDNISALEPTRFEEFVNTIRESEKALGIPDFYLTEKENNYRSNVVKCVVAAKILSVNEIITKEKIAFKRISMKNDITIHKIDDLIGKKLIKKKYINEPILKNDII